MLIVLLLFLLHYIIIVIIIIIIIIIIIAISIIDTGNLLGSLFIFRVSVAFSFLR